MSSTVTASARLFTAASSEYFSAVDSVWNSPTGSWYQAGWVKLTTNATQVVLLAKYGTGGNQGWQVYYNNATSKFGLTQSHDGTNTVGVEFGSTSATGTWFFIENYYDSVNQLCGININRGTDATVAQTNGQYASTLALRWGAQSGGFYANAAGGPMVWLNGMPTAGERDALYNSGNGVLSKDLPSFSTATIIAAYDFAETSGQAYDANGTNNLTDNNTVTSAAGKVTYTAEDASQFTSANAEYLSLSSPGAMNPGDTDFTVTGWMYLDAVGANRVMCGVLDFGGAGGNNYSWLITYLSASSLYRFDVDSAGTAGAGLHSILSTTVVYTSKWQFVAVRHDATANTIEIRVDNEAFQSASHSGGAFVGTAPFRIGAYNINGIGGTMDGRIANVNFWGAKLSNAQVEALYARGFGIDVSDATTTNCASWWGLKEASGTRADSVGSATLTDNNTVTGNPGVVYDATAPAPTGSIATFRNRISNSIGLGV